MLGADKTELSQCYELSDEAWQLLDGGMGRFGKGLAIKLSPTAASRLGLPVDKDTYIPFSFCRTMNSAQNQKPQLYLFGFGEGLLTVELSIDTQFLKKHQTSAVLEFIHAITHMSTHSSNISFLIKKGSEPLQQTHHKSNLLNIFQHLIGQNLDEQGNLQVMPINHPKVLHKQPLSRFFSYAALRLDSTRPTSIRNKTEVMRQKISTLAYSMAHRHTDHYLPTLESVSTGVYLPFENIAHCNSIEGGSIVIDTMSFKDSNNELSIIEHNQFYTRWRHAFGSDSLADELADDVLQVNNLLSYKLDKDEQILQEQKNKHFTVLGILATTLLTTIGIFETNFKIYSDPELKIFSWVTFTTLGVALMLAIIASYIYLKIFEKK